MATKHKKEQVIAPIMADRYGLTIVVPENFDTDKFGTFTRDIKRLGNQREAAGAKARAALEVVGADLVLASEGSFSADPQIPWLVSNVELVLLIDTKHNVEVIGVARSFKTNMAHAVVRSCEEACAFAEKVGFPEHGVIVRQDQNSSEMVKDLENWNDLEKVVKGYLEQSSSGTVFLETDMRAHRNPTRMKVIETATLDLITILEKTCEKCGMFGCVPVEVAGYLACEQCSRPTDIPGQYLYRCQRCKHESMQWLGEKRTVDPGQCGECNP